MNKQYDLLVIGAGSGGVAISNRAASYGAKCALVEAGRIGGTCVNVGCVPKKIMWNAANLMHALDEAPDYGIVPGDATFDWSVLRRQRDQYILDMNGAYERNLIKNGVELIRGSARFVGPATVKVGADTITAPHIVIATGGRAMVPELAPRSA
jgi:glutathione reductase (NADPH)